MSQIGSNVMTVPRVGGRAYYGWVVLGVAALAMVGTLPGRTQGLGLITEPLIRDLGLSRVAYAQVNLVATLIGALFCIGVGRLIDRLGSRLVLTVTAVALGLTVLTMSQASSLVGLLIFVTLTRGFGQSALVGGQPRDGGQVVPSPIDRGDGDLRARDEHRVHGGVSARGRGRAVGGLAHCVGVHRSRAARRARASRMVAGSIVARDDRSEP